MTPQCRLRGCTAAVPRPGSLDTSPPGIASAVSTRPRPGWSAILSTADSTGPAFLGGGVGNIHLELLGQGASRTTNLELVDAYDTDATDLAERAGMRDRMTRRQVDIAATPEDVEAHDIVVLHRVVCCYPDYERLLTAAADHAKRLLVLSHPPRNWVTRTFTRLQRVGFRLMGKSFRIFAHPRRP
jgi:hypothetical protein